MRSLLSCMLSVVALCPLSQGCGGPAFSAANGDASTSSPGDGGQTTGEAGPLGSLARLPSVTTLVEGETMPMGIAVGSQRIFWVDREDSAGGPGRVRSATKTLPSQASTLAQDQMGPLDIAVNLKQLVWSVSTGARSATPQCLAMTSKPDGSDAACLASALSDTLRMVITASYVVVAADDTPNPVIGFTSLLGGKVTSTSAQGPCAALVASDSLAYVGNAHGPHVDDLSLPSLVVGQGTCGTGCGTGVIVDLALDAVAGRVMWATSMGNIVSAPAGTMVGPATTLATVSGTPQRITRDASYIYVTSQSSPSAGAVFAVPVAGGAPITLAADENGPFGVAVDESNVFWTCADGTIRAVGVPMP